MYLLLVPAPTIYGGICLNSCAYRDVRMGYYANSMMSKRGYLQCY